MVWQILLCFVLIVLYVAGLMVLFFMAPLHPNAIWMRLMIGAGWAGVIYLLAALASASAGVTYG